MAKGFHFINYGPPAWKFGLMGGLEGMLKGFQDSYNNERMLQSKMSMAQMKADNDRALKMMELQANQRTFSVRTTDSDGKVRTHTFKNVYDPKTNQWSPQEIGSGAPDKPKGYGFTKTTDANGNPVVLQGNKDTGESKVVQTGKPAPKGFGFGGGTTYNKDTGAISPDGSGAPHGGRLTADQAAVNARDARKAGEEAGKRYDSMSQEDKDAALKAAGIDPSQGSNEDKRKAFVNAQTKNVQDYLDQHSTAQNAADDKAKAQKQANDNQNASNKAAGIQTTPDTHQPIFMKDGRPVISDGKGGYLPYTPGQPTPQPTVDDSSTPSADDYHAVGNDTPAQTSQLGPLMGPTANQGDEDEGGNPQASTDQDSDAEPEDEDTESEDDANRGMYPPGYPPKGLMRDVYSRYGGNSEDDDEEEARV